MTWEAVAAFGSIASALILLIGAVAAVVQIKHLRLANQLDCYLRLMHELNSAELVEARRFIESTDFTNPQALRAATQPELDDRIRRLATHFQAVACLLNLGVLNEEMFVAHIGTAALVWRAVRPVYRIMRERSGTPLLADVEYLVYRTARDQKMLKLSKRYPKEFLERSGLDRLIEKAQAAADSADASLT